MEFDFTSNIPSQKMESKGEAKLTRLLNSYGYLPVWSSVNPVNLNISIRVKKLTFRALALRQSDRANARNVSFFTLYGGQFTFSTQLLTLNYL